MLHSHLRCIVLCVVTFATLACLLQVMARPPQESSGIPVYVWAIVGAVGVGVLVAIVLAVVIFVMLKNKKEKSK